MKLEDIQIAKTLKYKNLNFEPKHRVLDSLDSSIKKGQRQHQSSRNSGYYRINGLQRYEGPI